MGRRRKTEDAPVANEDVESRNSSHGDVKRSIVAVVVFAVAVLSVLGFLDVAGPLGDFLDRGIALLLGVGKWIFPLVLVMAGLLLLRWRREAWSNRLRLIGLFVMFFGLLGFLHTSFDTDEMVKMAKAGRGGGLIGAGLAYGAIRIAGNIGGMILLGTFFLVGGIAAFNVSLVQWIEQARLWRAGRQDSDQIDEIETGEDDAGQEEIIISKEEDGLSGWEASETEQKEEPALTEEANIANIRFAGEESIRPADAGQQSILTSAGAERETAPRRKPKKIRWELPSFDLVDSYAPNKNVPANVDANALTIQRTLRHFDIEVELGEIQVGPTVTQYTFRPAVGVKLSKITTLGNDLTYALAATSIRIEAPIPGKSLVGIEVPNGANTRVGLRDLLEDRAVTSRKGESLLVALGKGVSGETVTTNLDKLPHVLIAGATNSGKSVCINGLLLSLLYHNTPDDLQLILVDPKRVELTPYNGVPHLKTPVIVEPKKVVGVLKWAVGEMENRYKVFERCGARDINSYRTKQKAGGTCTYTNTETNQTITEPMENFPYIVIVIDEMADLMMAHGKDVEALIVRLAQMSRAVGIHLVLATQRPSIEVITGLIKANITARIAFQVATQIDSRTILDMGGAEKLLGKGDMLYLAPTSPQPKRLQGVFVSEEEVRRVTEFWREQAKDHEEPIPETFASDEESGSGQSAMSHRSEHSSDIHGDLNLDAFNPSEEDERYEEAKQIVVETGKASTSFLQRRLSVGYSRAAKLLDLMERAGVIGPSEGGAKPRPIYVGPHAHGTGQTTYTDDRSDDTVREKWQA